MYAEVNSADENSRIRAALPNIHLCASRAIATNGLVTVSVKSSQTIVSKGLKRIKKFLTHSGGCGSIALPQERT
jgi:hypothetical protein